MTETLAKRVEDLKKLDPVMSPENRVGSARQAVMEAMADPNSSLHTLQNVWENTSQEEKNAGKLIGKLMQAKGNAQVDAAFNWFELEYNEGVELNPMQKNIALVTTIQHIAGASLDGIRILRKVLVTLNTK